MFQLFFIAVSVLSSVLFPWFSEKNSPTVSYFSEKRNGNFSWDLIGMVKGAEIAKGEESVAVSLGKNNGKKEKSEEESADNLLPPPVLQPVRKANADDLVLPNAHSSLIIDVDSGTILHYGKGKERRQIASLTKLMTALLVMEKVSNLDAEVTIDQEAVYAEGTKIGCPRSGYCPTERLKVGEKVKVRDLLKAMLMNSANDAAIALGKYIGGTQEGFARIMNARAKEMGFSDSHFCTPSGLEPNGHEKECYSSAYDIARIAAHTMKYDLIWEIFRYPETTISSVDGKYTHKIINTDQVLDEVPGCLGGKTGFTPLAGQSLLMAAADESKKHRIIAVLLDDLHRWQDIKTMFQWAFESYEWK